MKAATWPKRGRPRSWSGPDGGGGRGWGEWRLAVSTCCLGACVRHDRRPRSPTWRRRGRVVGQVAVRWVGAVGPTAAQEAQLAGGSVWRSDAGAE
jgi:hypothetical protein